MNREANHIDSNVLTTLPDWKYAALLGLSLEEYHDLSHRGLNELTDIFGNINEYYIQVSPNNKVEILNKLNPDQHGYIRFKPKQVYQILSMK